MDSREDDAGCSGLGLSLSLGLVRLGRLGWRRIRIRIKDERHSPRTDMDQADDPAPTIENKGREIETALTDQDDQYLLRNPPQVGFQDEG